jgi:hypothetical protein
MKGMKKWMLGAAVVAGALGLSAVPAQAARIGIYVGAPAAYMPPCPGPGYVWVDGYYANGAWVPGYWNYPGPRVGIGVRFGGPVARGYAGWGHDRGYDRGYGDRGYGRDHFRR